MGFWYFSITCCSCCNLLSSEIFAVGGNIHNPLDRSKSELRKEKVDLNKGEPFTIALFGVDSDAQRKVKMMVNVQIQL